jgi:dynein heavy chain
VRTFASHPDFDPDRIRQVSHAVAGLAAWVRAIDNYDRVARSVEPKREQLKLAEASHAACMVTLNEKLATLRDVEAKREKLEELFAKTSARKAELQEMVDSCVHKINRASELLERLGEEQQRWEAELASLTGRSQKCILESLLSSAYLTYAGAFAQQARAQLVVGWSAAAGALISTADWQFDIVAAIGDPVRIRYWQVCGLPTDEFSTANAILVEGATRHALCIDPHSQVARQQ